MARVAVTGAFSYSGRYLAKRLLEQGHTVVNLSSRPQQLSSSVAFSDAELRRVEQRPLSFREEEVTDALKGCSVLWCTYWIRFEKDGDTFDRAAARCASLFAAAKKAGVQRVVFTSHTHATEQSPYRYIAGKAKACSALRSSGLSFGIARPCGIFGDSAEESVLMNNAAWVLRRSPLFLLAGSGEERFQPIHVRDMAELLLQMGHLGNEDAPNEELDACGPDAPHAVDLFRALAKATGSWALVGAPQVLSTGLVTKLTQPINWYTGDILLDKDDLDLLCSGLTVAEAPSDPRIRERRSLLQWIEQQGPRLGQRYVSSMQRYYYQR